MIFCKYEENIIFNQKNKTFIPLCMYTAYCIKMGLVLVQRLERKFIFTLLIEQKGITFDHDFSYSFPLFSSLLKKEGREKKNQVSKIVIKSHAFLLDHIIGVFFTNFSSNKNFN